MKAELVLSIEQEKSIQILFEDMKSKAIPLGKKLIELEKKLNISFANRSITNKLLRQQLKAISNVQMQLRYVHLQTHLITPTILTPAQIAKYNKLRGYDSEDHCNNPPKGHDVKMWKQHNGCK